MKTRHISSHHTLALLLAIPCAFLWNSAAFAIDVYVVAGQSNGWRISHLQQKPGAEDVHLIHYFGMPCVSEPVKSRLRTLTALSEGPMGFGLASSVSSQAGADIVFIQYCRCGASVVDRGPAGWWPGDDPAAGKVHDNGLFGSFQKYVTHARRTVNSELDEMWKVRGLFWHQGESDSKRDVAAYEQGLRNLFFRFRVEFGSDLPIVAAHIREINAGSRAVNAAMDRVAATDPLTRVVKTADLEFESDHDGKPNVHFNRNGCHTLGRRMADAMETLRGPAE